MSYEIIKNIKIKDGKVFLTSSANNIYPHTFDEWECSSLTKILQEKGEDELDIEVLGEYEKGCFQRGNNKYTRALAVLRHMPEYQKYDWRCPWDKDEETNQRRASESFKELLNKAMRTYLPKERYILTSQCGSNVFYMKITRHCAKYRKIKKTQQFIATLMMPMIQNSGLLAVVTGMS